MKRQVNVAPSPGRGLKHRDRSNQGTRPGRPFTGAWIETRHCDRPWNMSGSRPFTGAWIETNNITGEAPATTGRPFTGAWIETRMLHRQLSLIRVAPSPGRGLKQVVGDVVPNLNSRPFTGAWIETYSSLLEKRILLRRPFTGAWIETHHTRPQLPFYGVAPSPGRGLKQGMDLLEVGSVASPLHRGVD